MSLRAVLRTASKLGIPVVLTNERGESPQVIMPFEDFSAMVGASECSCAKRKRSCCHDDLDEDDFDVEDVEDLDMEMPEELDGEDPFTIVDEPFHLSEKEKPARNEETDGKGMSLEDQFYFEPVEDKESL